jgi:hypothetical protein
VLRRFDGLVPDINTTSLGASTMTPTKPGWYLARLKSRDYEDREIVKVDNMLHVWQAGYARGWRLDDFNWFGQIQLDQMVSASP